MKKIFLSIVVSAALLSINAPAALAQTAKCTPGSEQGIQCPLDESKFGSGPSFFIDLVDKVSNWMFTFLLVATVVFIVYAAYNYLLSEGNEEKVGTAHKMMIYAAVAIAVALLSRGFVFVIKQTVGGANPAGAPAPADNGGDTTNNGGNNGNGANTPIQWSGIANFSSFPVQVQVCADGKIPGTKILSDENEDANGNPTEVASTPENTEIGNPPGPAATAGQFVRVGSSNTSIVGDPLDIFTTIGLATDYFYETETCNDGASPHVRISPSNDGNWRYSPNF